MGVKKKELEVWNHVCWNSWWIIQSQSVYQSTVIFVRQNDGKNTLSEQSHVKKKLINILNCSSKCFTRGHTQNRPLEDTSMRTLLWTWEHSRLPEEAESFCSYRPLLHIAVLLHGKGYMLSSSRWYENWGECFQQSFQLKLYFYVFVIIKVNSNRCAVWAIQFLHLKNCQHRIAKGHHFPS